MKDTARDFLTQEKVDKLQLDQDENNGIVDDDAIVLIMEEYYKHKLKSIDPSYDIRGILKKYIQQVIACEGISFVPLKAGERSYDMPCFTQEEVDYLWKLHEEINHSLH